MAVAIDSNKSTGYCQFTALFVDFLSISQKLFDLLPRSGIGRVSGPGPKARGYAGPASALGEVPHVLGGALHAALSTV